MSHRAEPQTVGDILKTQFLEPNLAKVRREFYYADIFRLYAVLGLNRSKRLFYNDLFNVLLTYDLDLLIAHRDVIMAQCVRKGISNHIILGHQLA